MILRLRLVRGFSILVLTVVPFLLLNGAESQAGPWITTSYVVQQPAGDVLTITSLATGHVVTNAFSAAVSDLQVCPTMDLLSIRLTAPTSSSSEYAFFDLGSCRLYSDPMFHLDAGERRWSPRGLHTYVSLGSSFGILDTSLLQAFLAHPSTNQLGAVVRGDPAGGIFQEAWLNDRFLLFATGQGVEMAWGLLDADNQCCYFVDAAGYRNRPALNVDARSLSRLQRLSAEALLLRSGSAMSSLDFWSGLKGVLTKPAAALAP